MAGALVAPLVGAAAGKALGGGKQKQTSTTSVDMPDWLREDYKSFTDRGKALADTPFTKNPSMRVAAPMTGYDEIFANPEMLQLQRQSDVKHYADLMPKTEEAAATPNPAVSGGNSASDNMMGRIMLQELMQGQSYMNPWSRFANSAQDADYADLAKSLREGGGVVERGAFRNPQTGDVVGLDILNRFR
jgi:hypothetical protein